MISKASALLLLSACIMLVLTACDHPSSDEDIKRWAGEYCRTAVNFTQDFMAKEVQPSGDWEASYEFIQHYRRVIEAADTAIQNLTKIHVPPEARDIHSTTIDALGNVQDIAQDAIRDVENATNRVLFQTAIDRYATRVREQSSKLDTATQKSSPRIRQQLASCAPQLGLSITLKQKVTISPIFTEPRDHS